jgi:hypothetical protein
MDALEFFKEFGRFCDENSCIKCAIYEKNPRICSKVFSDVEMNNIKEIIPIVEKWAEEHPIKNNLDVFKETFPEWGTYLHRCRETCKIDYQKTPCRDCKWWSEEFKENKC